MYLWILWDKTSTNYTKNYYAYFSFCFTLTIQVSFVCRNFLLLSCVLYTLLNLLDFRGWSTCAVFLFLACTPLPRFSIVHSSFILNLHSLLIFSYLFQCSLFLVSNSVLSLHLFFLLNVLSRHFLYVYVLNLCVWENIVHSSFGKLLSRSIYPLFYFSKQLIIGVCFIRGQCWFYAKKYQTL